MSTDDPRPDGAYSDRTETLRAHADEANAYLVADYPDNEPWVRGGSFGWARHTYFAQISTSNGLWVLAVNGVGYAYPDSATAYEDMVAIVNGDKPTTLRGTSDGATIRAMIEAVSGGGEIRIIRGKDVEDLVNGTLAESGGANIDIAELRARLNAAMEDRNGVIDITPR